MSKCGSLGRDPEGVLRGRVQTLKFGATLALHPIVGARGGDNKPTHRVCVVREGTEIEVGSAWTKTAQGSGNKFLSLSMDDPSWPHPLNLTAFADENNENAYDVVWQRPRRQDQAA